MAATLDDVVAELRGMRNDLAGHTAQFEQVHGDLIAVKQELSAHSVGLKELGANINGVRTELKSINKLLGQQSGEVAGVHEDITGLREDIQAMPQKFADVIRSELAPMQAAAGLMEAFTKLASNVARLDLEVERLKAKDR